MGVIDMDVVGAALWLPLYPKGDALGVGLRVSVMFSSTEPVRVAETAFVAVFVVVAVPLLGQEAESVGPDSSVVLVTCSVTESAVDVGVLVTLRSSVRLGVRLMVMSAEFR